MSLHSLPPAAEPALDSRCPRHANLDSLLVRVGEGDRSAFAAFYDETSRSVYGLSLSCGHEPALSAQVTLDVFLKAWQQAGAYDPLAESAWGWVRAIAFKEINRQVGARSRI